MKRLGGRHIVEKAGKELYPAVDIAKFFFSVCIVVLHTEVYRIFSHQFPYYLEKGVLRLAVPFFFCTSGFFICKKLYLSEEQAYKDIIKRYIIRLLLPLMFFEFINIILESIKMMMQGITPQGIVLDIVKHICFYPYGALWYIQASIVGIILAYPFIKRKKINLALMISGICYIFALLANNYYFLTERYIFMKDCIDEYLNLFISARNGVFVGFFMLCLGIKTYEIYVRIRFKRYFLILSGLILYLMYLGEIVSLKDLCYIDDGALYLTHILFIPVLLLNLLYSCGQRAKGTCLHIHLAAAARVFDCAELQNTVIFRNLSTGIYLVHRIIISLLIIIASLGIEVSRTKLSDFVIVLGSSIMLCLAAYRSKYSFFRNILK